MRAIVSLVVIVLINIHFNHCLDSGPDRMRICIINCGQCKAMYGEFFLGQQCAESCLIHGRDKDVRLPDCNSPKSILPYIKKVVDDNNFDLMRN